MDTMESSMCPWRGQELRWGLQLLGTVDASQLVPLARPLLLSWGSMVRYSEGNGTPLQYSCLENPMDRVAW